MEISGKRNIIVDINMFVHYPETYNANTISNKFSRYFKECILENKITDFVYNLESYVMINTAPHSEEELLKIDFCFTGDEVTLINKETFILDLKCFIIDYFNNKIKDIRVEIVSNK